MYTTENLYGSIFYNERILNLFLATKHPPATTIPKACTDILLYLIFFLLLIPLSKFYPKEEESGIEIIASDEEQDVWRAVLSFSSLYPSVCVNYVLLFHI